MSSDQFNIRWNNYTSVLQSVFRKLLEGEQFVDVTLSCEGKSIKCHRVILSACSTYFEQILMDNSYPHLVILVKDMKFWELQALVTFMYNGEVSVNQNKLSNLVKAAETLRIKGLAPDTSMSGDSEKIDEDDLEEYHQMDGYGKGIQEDHLENKQQQQQQSILRQMKRKVLTGPPKLAKIQRVERNSIGNGVNNIPAQAATIQEAVAKQRQQQAQAAAAMTQEMANHNHTAAEEEEEYENDYQQQENLDGTPKEEQESEEEPDETQEELNMQEDGVNSGDGQSSASDVEDPQAGTSGATRTRYVYKYAKDVRDSAMAALSSGISMRQCSEAFGIPRKTLSKWKHRGGYNVEESVGEVEEESTNVVVRRPTSGTQEVTDRAERLQKAMEMALSGVTVRQAAAHFEIPRTTLCAYMKRRGVASKRNFLSTNNPPTRKVLKPSTNSGITAQNLANFEDFPFLGISELMDEMEQGSYDAHQDK